MKNKKEFTRKPAILHFPVVCILADKYRRQENAKLYFYFSYLFTHF